LYTVLHLYLPVTGFDLSRIFNLVGPQTEHVPVRAASSISESLCLIFIYWTRDKHDVATVDTGCIHMRDLGLALTALYLYFFPYGKLSIEKAAPSTKEQ
jgi:hypothetical protein